MLLSGLLCQNIYAGGNDVHFYASIIDHSSTIPGGSKSPIHPLVATLDDHTLTFYSPFSESVSVELFDENDNLVYSDWLALGQISLVFPNTLSGEYTIRLTVGSIYFIGVVEL